MALLHCNVYSTVLGLATSVDVILPEPTAATAPPAPCLWLLHGRSDDHTIWQRRTSIERYAAPRNLAVVMPNVHRSYYTDMHHGYRYWTFVSEELPQLLRGMLRLSAAPAENFVAGLSMGGYGAFKLALRHPDRFAAAASLSGALDLAGRHALPNATPEDLAERLAVFGPTPVNGTDNDLIACATRLAASGTNVPPLYQWCGTEDFLYPDNLAFRDAARRLGLPLTYAEGPGGHTWDCWDRQIQRVLEWLPLPVRK